MELWSLFQEQILGMRWLNEWLGRGLSALGLDIHGRLGGSVQFFLYDSLKITVLLCVLIFSISYIQSYFPPERSKHILGRLHGVGANLVSALIHWPLLSAWNMDADTLRSMAEENTPLLFPPVLTPLTDLLLPSVYGGSPLPDLAETERDLETTEPSAAGTQKDTEPPAAAKGLETAEPAAAAEIPENGPALHVLTNRRGIYGASCMLYRDIIKDFADQEEADVIILPSSIHEVLLFPDHLMFDHAFLCRTVQEINREDVPEEDVLSDRIYIFSRETGTIIPSPLFSCHRPEPAGTESPW